MKRRLTWLPFVLVMPVVVAAERDYMLLVDSGWSPQKARCVLPNSLKTEIVMTANLREWRHVLTLRCSKAAHPQTRELMIPLAEEFKRLLPVFFEDITRASPSLED